MNADDRLQCQKRGRFNDQMTEVAFCAMLAYKYYTNTAGASIKRGSAEVKNKMRCYRWCRISGNRVPPQNYRRNAENATIERLHSGHRPECPG